MASSHTAKERFVVLDGLRGLAALVVITDHVHSDLLTSLLPGRYLAVDFFFVLSGFVLAHVYGGRLRTGMSPLAFMRARVIRLYPLYLVGALIGAAWAVLYAVKGWGAWSLWHVAGSALFALFMLPCPPGWSLWWNAPYPLNGPSWSLFFELLVNAAFAAVARWITPALCLVFMGLGALLLPFAAFGFGQLDGGFAWSNFVAGFPRVTFGFFAGVWIYQTRLHERVPALPAWSAYLALLAVFMVPAHGAWRAAFDLAAALVLFPSLVTVCASSPVRGPLLHVSSFIGAMSYGVYVLHVPLWGWLQLVIARFGQALPGAASVLVVAAVALGAAAALHVIYDAPLRRRLARPRPQAAAAAAGD
jgi:peptidoglycan/LPS O-acetylase OafA/YrhL